MPSRSLCVHPDWIETVQQAYESAYGSSRCPNQKDFADRIPVSPTQVGLSIDTLNKFRQGEPVARGYFYALCDRFGLQAEQVTTGRIEAAVVAEPSTMDVIAFAANTSGGELATVPPIIDAAYTDVQHATEQDVAKMTKDIEQTIETVEEQAIAVAEAEHVTVNTGDRADQSAAETKTPKPTEPAVPKDIKVKQSIKTVKRGGIAIGSTTRMTINQPE